MAIIVYPVMYSSVHLPSGVLHLWVKVNEKLHLTVLAHLCLTSSWEKISILDLNFLINLCSKTTSPCNYFWEILAY